MFKKFFKYFHKVIVCGGGYIKIVFRYIRSKLHNDIHTKLGILDDINMKLGILDDKLNHLNFIAYGILSNQIKFYVSESKDFGVNRHENVQGELPKPDIRHSHSVYISSLPKSGTHLVNMILKNLSYHEFGLHALDYELHPIAYTSEFREKLYENKILPSLFCPYTTAMQLVRPGQFFSSHISADMLQNAHQNGIVLLSVRDLRYAFVSLIRYLPRTNASFNYMADRQITPADLVDLINDDNNNACIGASMFTLAKGYALIKNEPFVAIVKFEELISHDIKIMQPSLAAIAKVTGCGIDDVYRAAITAQGQMTPTKTHKYSALDTLWTEEVEKAFRAKGGDGINEQLGYPRFYDPKNDNT